MCSILANLMTEAEDLKELRQMFTKWDTNADGHISLDELKQHMAEITSVFQLAEPDILKMMKAADSNDDGYVDYTEFLTAAFDKRKLLSEVNIDRAFNIFDVNGDGQISREELKQVFGGGSSEVTESLWNEIITECDQNNDGHISQDEFKRHILEVVSKRATFYNPAK